MITSLLIANRGEIARRIIRTASAMGITTVAVYAEGDVGAPYVREADRAVALPGRTAAQTYLNTGALLAAAARAGADAVHPGYGFLSERAEFARAVIGAGLTWVGPPPEAIEAMGDKLAAKRLMADVGVPVLPSWEIAGEAPSGLGDLPMPVIVKAAAGGGGKGMRVVDEPRELAEAVAAARREASAAFGDGAVFIERYVTQARHVEIQVLADSHGGAVHCFERECSIQRRHQKIIEECPSPALNSVLRDRMGAAALAAAKAVGYSGAGTVEFVLEPSGEFWFLEMNTRLQVEHPVTEAVTGIDLVREQLLAAQGLPLSVTQVDLALTGHAIEARLYAEDPAAGFLPATGTLLDWAAAASPPCRWDSGVEAGSVVGVEFDPMLAKVIAHAPTRREAALRLALALERTRIRGVTTNRDFLVAALRHREFLSGRTTTAFIQQNDVPVARRPSPAELGAAAIGAALAAQAGSRAAAPVLRTLPSGWRNSVMPPERATYRHGDNTLRVGYRRGRDGRFAVTIGGVPTDGPPAGPAPGNGADPVAGALRAPGGARGDGGRAPAGAEESRADEHPHGRPTPVADAPPGPDSAGEPASVADMPPGGEPVGGEAPRVVEVLGVDVGVTGGWIEFTEDGLWHRLHVFRHGDRVWVQGPDGDVELRAVPRFGEAEHGESVTGGLAAPMPGTVLAVLAAAGDSVAAGQSLMIVEAMKMEHRITAPHAGVVREVRAEPGQPVAAGDLLAVIDESESAS